jgi:hypothetical protein
MRFTFTQCLYKDFSLASLCYAISQVFEVLADVTFVVNIFASSIWARDFITAR